MRGARADLAARHGGVLQDDDQGDQPVGVFLVGHRDAAAIPHGPPGPVYLSQKIMVLTNKPTSVKTVLDNPLPLPRDVVSPEFVELRNKVTDLIKWW